MPIHEKYFEDFEEDEKYHVYNRTNNREILFLRDENKVFFLKKYKEIIGAFVDTYSWNLLSNHFHFLIEIKPEKEIIAFLNSRGDSELTAIETKFLFTRNASILSANASETKGQITVSVLIEQTFKRLFQSYALSFNKQQKRKGNLFHRPFKRLRIESDAQFTMALVYIHANAAKHGLVKDFTKHEWSSWHSLISDKPTSLNREEVIRWFGGIENCIKTHHELAAYYYNCEVSIED